MTMKKKDFKCYPHSNCKVCCNLVTSTSVINNTNSITINVPEKTYSNNQSLCLVVAQAVPEIYPPVPVYIMIENNKMPYPLRTTTGHNIYSDQIRSRTIYPLYAATDSQTFVYRYPVNKLPCTKHPFCEKFVSAVVAPEPRTSKNA